jgi:hypothetical protein
MRIDKFDLDLSEVWILDRDIHHLFRKAVIRLLARRCVIAFRVSGPCASGPMEMACLPSIVKPAWTPINLIRRVNWPAPIPFPTQPNAMPPRNPSAGLPSSVSDRAGNTQTPPSDSVPSGARRD